MHVREWGWPSDWRKNGSKDRPTIRNLANPELYLGNLVSPDLGDLLVTDKGSQLEDGLPPKGQSQVPAVGVKCLSLLVLHHVLTYPASTPHLSTAPPKCVPFHLVLCLLAPPSSQILSLHTASAS